MTRNGATRPLPKKLTSTPSCNSQTLRGRSGLKSAAALPSSPMQHTLHATYVAGPRPAGLASEQTALHFITRERIHVDRTATAWAIRRFIDPGATFEFVPRTRDISKLEGIPFDVRGAELSHREGRCTFERLLDKYELRDPALRRMARILR